MEAMVDGDGDEAAPPAFRPRRRQMQQGHGVAAAGQGHGDRGVDMGQQARLETGRSGDRRVGRQVQLARVLSWPARVRRAAGAPSA